MTRKKRTKRTAEERAAERARREDLTRRLQSAIERYRARSEHRLESPIAVRKNWSGMSREERVAERARSRDLDRRLRAAIERYRAINAEKRRRREAEAS